VLNKDLRAWFKARMTAIGYPDEDIIPGPDLDDNYVGRYILITPVSGAPMSTEWLFENPGFQIRTIGEQGRGDPEYQIDSVEELAYAADRAILTAPFPQTIGGRHVVRFQRFGSGPVALGNDDADRAEMVCTYIVEVGSGY
jgi:hypothetical protein